MNSTDIMIGLLVVMNLTNLALWLYSFGSKKKLVRGLSNIIHDFEKDRACMLHIEMVNPENVYLRNPKR